MTRVQKCVRRKHERLFQSHNEQCKHAANTTTLIFSVKPKMSDLNYLFNQGECGEAMRFRFSCSCS